MSEASQDGPTRLAEIDLYPAEFYRRGHPHAAWRIWQQALERRWNGAETRRHRYRLPSASRSPELIAKESQRRGNQTWEGKIDFGLTAIIRLIHGMGTGQMTGFGQVHPWLRSRDTGPAPVARSAAACC